MKTIILPGYSLHNKDWAEEVAKKINLGHEVVVHNWKHWTDSGSVSLYYETQKIIEKIAMDEFNLIAKSVGVYVALNLIPKISAKVRKVILCGIASISGDVRKNLVKTLTTKIPVENILCIQNENDKFVTFSEAVKFYHSVNPETKVISKPRSDHEYPFIEDFRNFLSI